MATYQQQLDPLNKKRAELDAQRQKLNSQLTSLNAGRDKLLTSEPGRMIGAGKDAVYAPGSATLTAEARIAETQRQLAAQAPQYKALTNQYNAITKAATTDANLQRAGLAPTQPAIPVPSLGAPTTHPAVMSLTPPGAAAKQPTTDPAKLSLAPGSMAGQPEFPAPPVTAKPDSPGAATAATPAAANPNEVIGTFNGRAITRAESDRLAGKLPTASGPVVMGPNGSYAASTGGSAQPAGYAANLMAPSLDAQTQSAARAAPVYVPSYFEGLYGSASPSAPKAGTRPQPSPALLGQLPVWPGSPAAHGIAPQKNPTSPLEEVQGSAVIGDPSKGTEAERAKLMSNLSSQINELQMGGANMRSKRDLLSTLIGMQTRMNEAKAGNEVTLAGQQNAANIAALNEQGAWNRSVLGEQGANRRADMTDATNRYLGNLNDYGASFRTLMGLQPKAEYAADTNGNTVRVDGTQYTAVTGADGSPLRTQQTGATFKDMAPIYVEQIKGANAILTDTAATPEMKAKAAQDIETINQLMRNGGQGAASNAASQALTDAKAAIATGKISKEDAAKRLREAGYSTEAGQL